MAVAYHDPGLSEIAYTAQFANISGDPRWAPLLRKLGKSPEQLGQTSTADSSSGRS